MYVTMTCTYVAYLVSVDKCQMGSLQSSSLPAKLTDDFSLKRIASTSIQNRMHVALAVCFAVAGVNTIYTLLQA